MENKERFGTELQNSYSPASVFNLQIADTNAYFTEGLEELGSDRSKMCWGVYLIYSWHSINAATLPQLSSSEVH